jgi:hypothetical protein
VDPAGELVGRQEPQIGRPEPPPSFLVDMLTQALDLCGVPGDADQAVLDDVGLHPLVLGDVDDLVDRFAHGGQEVHDALVAVRRSVPTA